MEKWVMMKVQDYSMDIAESAKYSNADKHLCEIDSFLQIFEKMREIDIKMLKPSLDDPSLLTQKEIYLQGVQKTVFTEETDVMFVTAKKVLARFWRHIVQKD